MRAHGPHDDFWSLPVVGETYDGVLNDVNGFHVRPEHLDAALGGATGGPVAEGAVGGGTGMICHEFKGGIGTASRVVPVGCRRLDVGALVQANYGSRDLLRIDGVPIGEAIPTSEVPSPWDAAETMARARAGSGVGGRAAWSRDPARSSSSSPPTPRSSPTSASGWRSGPALGSPGWAASPPPAPATSSSPSPRATGDCPDRRSRPEPPAIHDVRMVDDARMTPLFQAAVEAVEEAIVNALLVAGTMTGADGITAHGLDGERVVEIMARYGRGPLAGSARVGYPSASSRDAGEERT